MKLKLPSMPKLPKLRWPISKRQPLARPRPARYQAATRRATPAIDDYDHEEQPTTKLSSAFIVVLILHVVAVGGIFAFKGIKAHRHEREVAASVKADKPVVVKPADAMPAPVTAVPRPAANPAPAQQRLFHARGGETVAKVAALQGVSAPELAQLNGITQATVLKPNQTLVIPPTKPALAKPAAISEAKKADFLKTKTDENATAKPKTAASGKTYTVAKGDTVFSIAQKFGITSTELMKANKIEDSKKLQIAQVLKVPSRKSD